MRPRALLSMFLPDPGRYEQNVFWFPVRIVATLAAGYLFEEVEITPSGATRVKRGGRYNTPRDPAYALFDGAFGEGDGALCRWAPGAGNRAWELVDIDKRMSGSGAGAIAGCDLETVSFDVVTGVSCDASGGLTVTTRRISITGCNLSVTRTDSPAWAGVCDAPAFPDGAASSYTNDVSGGSGDFAALNGTWTYTHAGGNTWAGTLGTASATLDGSTGQIVYAAPGFAPLLTGNVFGGGAFQACGLTAYASVDTSDPPATGSKPTIGTLSPVGPCSGCP